MFHHDFRYFISYILTNTKPLIFRIPSNQSIANTAWRCFNFSFFVQGHSNLNCLQGRVGKSRSKLCCIVILDTIRRCKIVRWKTLKIKWRPDDIVGFRSLTQGDGLLLFWERSEWVIQLKGLGWVQPWEYFANLELLNAWILLFWRLRKANLKDYDSEN